MVENESIGRNPKKSLEEIQREIREEARETLRKERAKEKEDRYKPQFQPEPRIELPFKDKISDLARQQAEMVNMVFQVARMWHERSFPLPFKSINVDADFSSFYIVDNFEESPGRVITYEFTNRAVLPHKVDVDTEVSLSIGIESTNKNRRSTERSTYWIDKDGKSARFWPFETINGSIIDQPDTYESYKGKITNEEHIKELKRAMNSIKGKLDLAVGIHRV